MPDEKVIMGSVTAIDVNDLVLSPEKQENEIILPEYVRAYIQRMTEKEESVAVTDQNKSDWHALARVMDRLFLIIFLALMMNQYYGVYNHTG